MSSAEPKASVPIEQKLEQHFSKIEATLEDIDKTEKEEKKLQKQFLKNVIFKNFFGGISWALGATIGVSLLITIVTLLVRKIDLIPIIGSFLSRLVIFILKNNHLIAK